MKASDVFVLFVDKKTSDLEVYDTWNIRIFGYVHERIN